MSGVTFEAIFYVREADQEVHENEVYAFEAIFRKREVDQEIHEKF